MARKIDKPQSFDVILQADCAYESCNQGATVKLKTITGWANLCLTHYERHFKRESMKSYRELGLERWTNENQADHRKRVFAYIRLMAKSKRFEEAELLG